jgi:hypothetical protein
MKSYINLLAASSLYAMVRMAPADDAGSFTETEFSLADLADLDVSEIEEIRFETLPQGVYEFEVVSAKLEEGANKEGEKRFWAIWEYKVVAVKSVLQAGVDKESLVGKKHGDKLWINPAKPQDEVSKAIGRIRSHVTDMGCDSAGKLGDIVKNTDGHIFTAKVRHQVDKDDKSVVYARTQLEAKKK